jgi:hypothetical protein
MGATRFSAAAGVVGWAKAAGTKATNSKAAASDSTAISALILMSGSFRLRPQPMGASENLNSGGSGIRKNGGGLRAPQGRGNKGRDTGSRDHPLPRWVDALEKRPRQNWLCYWGARFRPVLGRALPLDRRTPEPTCQASYAIDAQTSSAGGPSNSSEILRHNSTNHAQPS